MAKRNQGTESKSVLHGQPKRRLRTTEDLLSAGEAIFDAVEHGRCSPKQIDGLNTIIKNQIKLTHEIPLRLMSLIVKSKGEIRPVGEELKKLAAGSQ